MKPIMGAKNSRNPRATIDIKRITITPRVKNRTVGTNSTKAVIINVDNDNIKAMNISMSTNRNANPKNMKNPNTISTIRMGIDIIIKGDMSNANKNKNGRPSIRKGNNTKNNTPAPNSISGLIITSKTKNVPIVKNTKLPKNIIAIIAKPPNTNAPASINGRKITKILKRPLNIIEATIENAVIGIDKAPTKIAMPIQKTNVTPMTTMIEVIKAP